MKTETSFKWKLSDEGFMHVYKDNPEYFDLKEKANKFSFKKGHKKMSETPKEFDSIIQKAIGTTYFGYLFHIVKSIDYNNVIDRNHLRYLGIKDGVINNRVKPVLKNAGLIKKYNETYYLNPVIATKGTTVDKDLVDLFKEDNKKYGFKL